MKTSRFARGALGLGLALFALSCRTPPVPPESARAAALEQELWRAGGAVFAPGDYELFRQRLKTCRRGLESEAAKFGWFRDYGPVRDDLAELLRDGEEILARIRDHKADLGGDLARTGASLAARVAALRRMTSYFNESADVLKNATQAEIQLAEAKLLAGKEGFAAASACLNRAAADLERAEDAVSRVFRRYLDPEQLGRWRRWAEQTVAESKTAGRIAILVNKVERRLLIYDRGRIAAEFEIGLGKFGLSDKAYAGDDATPEGRYKIIRRIPGGAFSKALLINYPNDDDRREFARGKQAGWIPRSASIGGDIEIHGGGKDNLTRGCVGLENRDMDEVYRLAAVGTPVTIVGAVRIESTVLAEVERFVRHD